MGGGKGGAGRGGGDGRYGRRYGRQAAVAVLGGMGGGGMTSPSPIPSNRLALARLLDQKQLTDAVSGINQTEKLVIYTGRCGVKPTGPLSSKKKKLQTSLSPSSCRKARRRCQGQRAAGPHGPATDAPLIKIDPNVLSPGRARTLTLMRSTSPRLSPKTGLTRQLQTLEALNRLWKVPGDACRGPGGGTQTTPRCPRCSCGLVFSIKMNEGPEADVKKASALAADRAEHAHTANHFDQRCRPGYTW